MQVGGRQTGAPCRIEHTLVEEGDLGGNVAAVMIFDDGVVGVTYDPTVVHGSHLGLLRLWWRAQVTAGWACRVLWAADLRLLDD